MAKAKVNKKVGLISVELPECPACLNVMSSPIFQCQSGHSLCSSCTKKLCPSICPLCRQTMTQIRNWQLEDLVSKATVACPNKSFGCVYTMIAKNVEDHLKECIFREMQCPLGIVFGKCSWIGKLKEILAHFKESHPQNCNISMNTDIHLKNISISADDRYMYIIEQGKYLFILSIKIDTCQKLAYWAIQHIGSKKTAQQHSYEITISSNKDSKRQVIFADTCYNDAFDINEIFQQGRCGVMPLIMLAHFIKDGNLIFKFNITRTNTNFKNRDKSSSSTVENNHMNKGEIRQGDFRSKSPCVLNTQHKGPRHGFNHTKNAMKNHHKKSE